MNKLKMLSYLKKDKKSYSIKFLESVIKKGAELKEKGDEGYPLFLKKVIIDVASEVDLYDDDSEEILINGQNINMVVLDGMTLSEVEQLFIMLINAVMEEIKNGKKKK